MFFRCARRAGLFFPKYLMKNRPHLFRKLFSELMRLRDYFAAPPKKTCAGRLRLEVLEDRAVPAAGMSVVKVDAFAPGGDLNTDGVFQPGDTIRYTVTIANTGDVDLTGVTFADVEDLNTTLGSVNVSPLAINDTFTAVANTQLRVGNPAALSGPALPVAGSVIANDTEFLSDTFTISAFQATSTNGGTVNMVTTGGDRGSFSYVPAAGFTGTDTFTYTIRDDGFDSIAGNADDLTSVGTVTITVGTQKVWYVNSAAATNGDGRSSSPFNTLSAATVNGAGGAGDVDAANDIIYLASSGTNYTGGLALEANQQLIGGGVSLIVGGFTLQAAGTNPTIVNAAGDAVALSTNNTLRGFSVGNTSGNMIVGTSFGTLTGDTLTLNGTAARLLDLTTGTANATFTQLSTTSATAAYVRLSTVAGTLDLGTGTLSGAAAQGFIIIGGTVSTTYSGNASYAAAGQLVAVQNHTTGTITFQTGTLSATNGSGLFFSNADGTYNFNGTTTLNGGDAGIDIVSGSGGTFTFGSNTSITNPSGAAYNEDTSTANVTYNGTITQNTANNAVNINAKTGGTTAFSGAITASTTTATAIDLTNTGGTVNFTSGSLVINTTSGVGFNATGGGTISVTGATNTITSTTATALNVANTTIGASGLTFRSMSANGGTNGIVLNNTGGLGGLTVTGTGTTDGSGGTIQNTTGRGASFISASNITLRNMNFTNAGTSDLDADNSGLSTGDNLAANAAIHLQSVTTATLDNLNLTGGAEMGINGNTVSNFVLKDSAITGFGNSADEDGIHFFNMSGSSAIINTTVANSFDDHLNLQTNAGTLDLIISGGSFNSSTQGSGLLFGIRGTTNATIDISGVTTNTNFSGGIVADAFDNSTMNLRVTGSTSSGNNDQLSVSAGDNSQVDLEATGNTLSSVAAGDFVVIGLLGSAFDNGFTFDARIHNNNITVANNLTADGMLIFNAGGGAMNVAITGNTFDYAGTQRGIAIQTGQDGAGIVRATITGNTMDIKLDGTGNAVNGILAQSGVASPSGDGASIDASIGGAGALANTFTHSLGGTLAGGDIRIRQRFNNNVNLDGYAGGTTDTTAVAAYMDGRNNEVSPSTASHGGGTGAFTGTASPTFITVAVAPTSVLEDGGTNLVYTFTRSGSTAASLVANFAITGTANSTDFAVTGATSYNSGTGLGTITFGAGSATTQITVDPTADSDATEFDESVVVDVGNSGTANGSFARGVITDDSPLLFTQTPANSDQGGEGTPLVVQPPVNGETPVQPPAIVDDGILSQAELDSLIGAAIARWEATGLTAPQLALLHSVTFSIEDMPGWYLGSAAPGHVILDSNAAGNSWFIDPTPLDDSEFSGSGTQLTATTTGGAAGRVDALTTVMHELGHQLGIDDSYDIAFRDNLMYGFIGQSERRLPATGQADGADPSDHEHHGPDFLFSTITIGSLPIGKSVIVQFDATINANIPTNSVSNQGTGDSDQTTPVLSDDTAVGGATDPTVTPVDLPDVTVALPTRNSRSLSWEPSHSAQYEGELPEVHFFPGSIA